MAEEKVPEVVADLRTRADEEDSELPEGVDVPLRGCEDEAMRAVQQQFKDAGTNAQTMKPASW
jgi:hypothetical protein